MTPKQEKHDLRKRVFFQINDVCFIRKLLFFTFVLSFCCGLMKTLVVV